MSVSVDANQDPNVDPDEGLGEDELADRLEQNTEQEGENLAGGPDLAALTAQVQDLTKKVANADQLIDRQGQELGFYRQQQAGGQGVPGGGAVPAGTEGYPSPGTPGVGSPGGPGAPAVDPIQTLIDQRLLQGDVGGFAQGLRGEFQQVVRQEIQAVGRVMQSATAEQKAFLEDHPEIAKGDGNEFFRDSVAALRMQMPNLPQGQIMQMAQRRVVERLGRLGVEYDREAQEAQDTARGMQTAPGSGARKAGAGRPRVKSRDEIQAEHNVAMAKVVSDHQKASKTSGR